MMAMNQSCYGLRGKQGIADYFVYFTVRRNVADLQRKGHGSVFNTITRDTFKSIRVPAVVAKLTRVFADRVSACMERVLVNVEQSCTLAAARDALLPKLLSGQIRVPAADRFVEDTP
jgi:type I restriction enzyme S subunit